MAPEDTPPQERLSIACQACAKAKAKCDKKFACSRCQAKRIPCVPRATRRSSNQSNARRSHSRAQSDQVLSAPAGHFQMMQMTTPPVHGMSLYQHNINTDTPPLPLAHRQHSVSQVEAQMTAMYGQHGQDQYLLHHQFAQSPSDLNMSAMPPISNLTGLEEYVPLGEPFNSETENSFASMDHTSPNTIDFDVANMLDIISPTSMMHSIGDPVTNAPSLTPSSSVVSLPVRPGSVQPKPKMEVSEGTYSGKASNFPSPPISPPRYSDFDLFLASLEAWPYFRCNPINASDLPKTQALYVDGLAQLLRSSVSWTSWTAEPAEMEEIGREERDAVVKPMYREHRELWLGIAHFVLRKAQDIHGADFSSREDSPPSSQAKAIRRAPIMTLPPPDVITFYLSQYILRNKLFYYVPPEASDPSKLLSRTDGNLEPACLSLLFMVAQGASAIPTTEACSLATGLTEACRISLFDMIEKDIHMARNPILLHSALLFINLAAWSGDKWQMDIATGQQGMYLAMLTHSGMLRDHDNRKLFESEEELHESWLRWREREAQSRLAYSWVIVDQELSLFADAMPVLSVRDLRAPTPDDDVLWQAESESVWFEALKAAHVEDSISMPSLSDLFARFLKDDLRDATLSPMQLRLLLHPLQAMICQQRTLIDCTSNVVVSENGPQRNITKFSSRTRLEEVSGLLDRWCELNQRSCQVHTGSPETTASNLIMYNLVALNTTTSFDAIEKFTRGAVCFGPLDHPQWLKSRAVESCGEAIFRCGQIFRLVRTIPEQTRPLWWAGAIYRASLIAWAASMAIVGEYPWSSSKETTPIQLDVLEAGDPRLFGWHEFGRGLGVFTMSNEHLVSVKIPENILLYAVDFLSQSSTSRLAEGLKQKFRSLTDRLREAPFLINPVLSSPSQS